MADTEDRLRQLEDGWQSLSTGEQQQAVAELDAIRGELDTTADTALIDRIEALKSDLTLTVGLQPPSEELGFKG